MHASFTGWKIDGITYRNNIPRYMDIEMDFFG